eukprot:scaffold197_cov129-Cylindrotheca_fusiformis.AAC.2
MKCLEPSREATSRSRYCHPSRDGLYPAKQKPHKDERSTCSTVATLSSESLSLVRSDTRHEEQPFDECDRTARQASVAGDLPDAPFDEKSTSQEKVNEEESVFGDLRETPSDELPDNRSRVELLDNRSRVDGQEGETIQRDQLHNELSGIEDPVIPNPFATSRIKSQLSRGEVAWPTLYHDCNTEDDDETDHAETTTSRRPLHITDNRTQCQNNDGRYKTIGVRGSHFTGSPSSFEKHNKISRKDKETSLLAKSQGGCPSQSNICSQTCIREAKRAIWIFPRGDLSVIEPEPDGVDDANVRRSENARATRRSRLSSEMMERSRKATPPVTPTSLQGAPAATAPSLYPSRSQKRQQKRLQNSAKRRHLLSQQLNSRDDVLSGMVDRAVMIIQEKKTTNPQKSENKNEPEAFDLEAEVRSIMDKELRRLFQEVDESLKIFSFPSDESCPESSSSLCDGNLDDRHAEELILSPDKASPPGWGKDEVSREKDTEFGRLLTTERLETSLSREAYIDAHYENNLLLDDDDDMDAELANLHLVERKIESELSEVDSAEEKAVEISTSQGKEMRAEGDQSPNNCIDPAKSSGVNTESRRGRTGKEMWEDWDMTTAMLFSVLESIPTDEKEEKEQTQRKENSTNDEASKIVDNSNEEIHPSEQEIGKEGRPDPKEQANEKECIPVLSSEEWTVKAAASGETDGSFDSIARWRARISDIVDGGNLLRPRGDDPRDEKTVCGASPNQEADVVSNSTDSLKAKSEDTGISDPSDEKIMEALFGSQASEDANTTSLIPAQTEAKRMTPGKDEMILETVYAVPSLEMITEALFTLSEEKSEASETTEGAGYSPMKTEDRARNDCIEVVSRNTNMLSLQQKQGVDKSAVDIGMEPAASVIEQRCRYACDSTNKVKKLQQRNLQPKAFDQISSASGSVMETPPGLLGIQPIRKGADGIPPTAATETDSSAGFVGKTRQTLLGIQPMAYHSKEEPMFVSAEGTPVTSMLSPSAGSASAHTSWEEDSVRSIGYVEEDTRKLVREGLLEMKKPLAASKHTPIQQSTACNGKINYGSEKEGEAEFYSGLPSLLSASTESMVGVPREFRGKNYPSLLSVSTFSAPTTTPVPAVRAEKAPVQKAKASPKKSKSDVLGKQNKQIPLSVSRDAHSPSKAQAPDAVTALRPVSPLDNSTKGVVAVTDALPVQEVKNLPRKLNSIALSKQNMKIKKKPLSVSSDPRLPASAQVPDAVTQLRPVSPSKKPTGVVPRKGNKQIKKKPLSVSSDSRLPANVQAPDAVTQLRPVSPSTAFKSMNPSKQTKQIKTKPLSVAGDPSLPTNARTPDMVTLVSPSKKSKGVGLSKQNKQVEKKPLSVSTDPRLPASSQASDAVTELRPVSPLDNWTTKSKGVVLKEQKKRIQKKDPLPSPKSLDLQALSKTLLEIRKQEQRDAEAAEKASDFMSCRDENTPPIAELEVLDLSAVVISDLEMPPRKRSGFCDCGSVSGVSSSDSSKGNSLRDVQYVKKFGKQVHRREEEQTRSGLEVPERQLSAPAWSMDPIIDEQNADSIVKALDLVLKTSLEEKKPEIGGCVNSCVTPIATESFNAFSHAIFPRKTEKQEDEEESLRKIENPCSQNNKTDVLATEQPKQWYPPPPSIVEVDNRLSDFRMTDYFMKTDLLQTEQPKQCYPPPPSIVEEDKIAGFRVTDYYPYPPENVNVDWGLQDESLLSSNENNDTVAAMRSLSTDMDLPLKVISQGNFNSGGKKRRKTDDRRKPFSTNCRQIRSPSKDQLQNGSSTDRLLPSPGAIAPDLVERHVHFASSQTSVAGRRNDNNEDLSAVLKKDGDFPELTMLGLGSADAMKENATEKEEDWQPSTLPLEQFRREGGLDGGLVPYPPENQDSMEAVRETTTDNKNQQLIPFSGASSSCWCYSDSVQQVLGTVIGGCYEK